MYSQSSSALQSTNFLISADALGRFYGTMTNYTHSNILGTLHHIAFAYCTTKCEEEKTKSSHAHAHKSDDDGWRIIHTARLATGVAFARTIPLTVESTMTPPRPLPPSLIS
mmetsp:Transcript_29945/g.48009  ORF Transcript_29945/g.48009 Transcript_29945/m.48009 type:complete len:111 (-) Transcript_29945:1284-1616(-)